MTAFNYKKNYRKFRETNPKWFSGKVQPEQVDAIANLVEVTSARTLLDFGSGQGYQYLSNRIHERWGGILPICYDPGVIQLETLPKGKFDGVICTDVMEHIHPRDITQHLRMIFGYVNDGGFVYFLICCRPAHKTFPNGENVHLTIEPPAWWRSKLRRIYGLGFTSRNLIIEDDYEWFFDNCGDNVQSDGV